MAEEAPVQSSKAEDSTSAIKQKQLNALNAYVSAQNRDERATLIRTDKDFFLNGAADQWFWQAIIEARAENDHALVDSLRHGRLELWRCRHEGIDTGVLPVPAPESVQQAVAEFISAEGDEKALELLAARGRDLFTRPADRLVSYTSWLHQDDWPTAHAVARRHQLLSDRRSQETQQSLDRFMELPPGAGRRQFAQTHPELLWPEVAVSLTEAVQLAPNADSRQLITEAVRDLDAASQMEGANLSFVAPAASRTTTDGWLKLVPAELHEIFAEVRALELRLREDKSAAAALVDASERVLGRLPTTVGDEVPAALHSIAAKAHLNWPARDRRPHLTKAIDHAVESLRLMSPRVNPLLFQAAGSHLLECFELPIADGGPDLATAERCWHKLNGFVTPERDADHYSALQRQLGNVFMARVDEDRDSALRWATQCFKNASLRLPENADPKLVAELQFEWGLASYLLSRGDGVLLNRAIECYQSVLQVLPPQVSRAQFVRVQRMLGMAYLNLPTGPLATNLELAILHFEEALRVCTPAVAPLEFAEIQNNLGNACRRLGAIREPALIQRAIEHYEEALRYRPAEKVPVERATTLNNLGVAYAAIPVDATVNLRRAVDYYRKAEKICPPSLDPTEYGRILMNLGVAYALLSSVDGPEKTLLAIATLEEALRYRPRDVMPSEHATVLANLAGAFFRLRENEALRRAIYYTRAALRIYTRQRFPHKYGTLQMNLGAIWSCLDRGYNPEHLRAALECLDEAITVVTRENSPREYGAIQMNRGTIYDRMPPRPNAASQKRAIACYEDALTVFKPPEQYPVEYGDLMDNLGNSYSCLDENEANSSQTLYYYAEALRFRTAEFEPIQHRTTQCNLGKFLFKRQRWQEADTAYHAAIAVDERLFRSSATQQIWKEEGDTYQNAAFSATLVRGSEAGLRILVKGQARALSSALRLTVPRPNNVSTEVWTAFKAAGDAIRAATRAVTLESGTTPASGEVYAERLNAAELARAEFDAAIAQIRLEAPEFLKESDAADLCEQLDEGTALVAICVTSQGSKAFLMTRGTWPPRVVDFPRFKAADLGNLVLDQEDRGRRDPDGWIAGYLRGDRARWRATIDRVLLELGRDLLTPLAAAIEPPIKQLIFIGGGLLALLPLHAAPLSDSGSERLADRYEISYVPSLEVLAGCLHKARRGHGDDLYAVVNPRDDVKLPYTPFESASIGAYFPTRTIRAGLTGTRAAFCEEARGRAYVHFSGHGAYEWLAPNRSGLELADARLSVADLQSGLADLSAARLVSLSACESGLIDVLRGSEYEYVGLSAGFLLAGVSCVVSSLWQVPELATSLLMERFYANHRSHGMTMSASLAAAQRSVRKMPMTKVAEYAATCLSAANPYYEPELFKWYRHYRLRAQAAPAETPFEHPYYWAAFTVNGM